MTIARKRFIQKAVSKYVTTWSNVSPQLSGDELKTMGYTPGPQFKMMLNHLIEAQLDGHINTKEEAVALIRRTYNPATPPRTRP